MTEPVILSSAVQSLIKQIRTRIGYMPNNKYMSKKQLDYFLSKLQDALLQQADVQGFSEQELFDILDNKGEQNETSV